MCIIIYILLLLLRRIIKYKFIKDWKRKPNQSAWFLQICHKISQKSCPLQSATIALLIYVLRERPSTCIIHMCSHVFRPPHLWRGRPAAPSGPSRPAAVSWRWRRCPAERCPPSGAAASWTASCPVRRHCRRRRRPTAASAAPGTCKPRRSRSTRHQTPRLATDAASGSHHVKEDKSGYTRLSWSYQTIRHRLPVNYYYIVFNLYLNFLRKKPCSYQQNNEQNWTTSTEAKIDQIEHRHLSDSQQEHKQHMSVVL